MEVAVSFGIVKVDGTDDSKDESNHDEQLYQAQMARCDSHRFGAALDGFDGAIEETEGGEEEGGVEDEEGDGDAVAEG